MSVIGHTEAVVLRTVKYSESSVIATFYTERYGKIGGVIKGARRPKSKFGSLLQPTARLSLVVYHTEGRELHTIGQCDPAGSYTRLWEEIEPMAAGMAVVELLAGVTHAEEPNPVLYRLLTDTLGALDAGGTNVRPVMLFFQIRLAGELGFQPQFDRCVGCGRTMETAPGTERRYHLDHGAPSCAECPRPAGPAILVRQEHLEGLSRVAACTSPADAGRVVLQDDLLDAARGVMMTYLKHHVAGLRDLKSERVFSTILRVP
jgi:DNA repair protein RecO